MRCLFLLRGIISIPAPLFKRGVHFVERFLHFCCRWRKNRLQGGDLLEVEPLVCRVRVMVLRACPGVSTRCLSGVLRSLLSILAHPPQ